MVNFSGEQTLGDDGRKLVLGTLDDCSGRWGDEVRRGIWDSVRLKVE